MDDTLMKGGILLEDVKMIVIKFLFNVGKGEWEMGDVI